MAGSQRTLERSAAGIRVTELQRQANGRYTVLQEVGGSAPGSNSLPLVDRLAQSMHRLLKYTVQTVVGVGLLDLAVQAVDGTKMAANAAGDQTCEAARLERLLARTEDAIGELEAQNKSVDEPSPPQLPAELQQAQVLRERIQHAMSRLAQDHRITQVNLTNQDAQFMKGRQERWRRQSLSHQATAC